MRKYEQSVPKLEGLGTVWRDSRGRPHREGGLPSMELLNGGKRWHIHGDLHREDGPAEVNPDGSSFYWLFGRPMSPSQHREIITTKTIPSWWAPWYTPLWVISDGVHIHTRYWFNDCVRK